MIVYLATRLRITIIDLLYCNNSRKLLSIILYIISFFLKFIDKIKSDRLLMKAHSYCDSLSIQKYLEPRIKYISNNPLYIESLLPKININRQELLSWLLIIKPYRNQQEKGVIKLNYSETFYKFYKYYDVKRLLQDYYLVLEPNWAGYCVPQIMLYCKTESNSVIVEATDRLDFDFVNRLDSDLVPIALGPGDWINPDNFYPISSIEKKYDCCMVCGWADYKRHHILLRALSKIKKHNIKAVLVGHTHAGMKPDKIEQFITFYGLKQNITLLQNLSPEEVNIIYNESKVNLLLSYKEGGNKTLFEGMFANTPAILIKDNIGVNKDRINNETGILVSERDLPAVLVKFSKGSLNFSPREWAINNISCIQTTKKLNATIREIALKNGERWDEEIRVNFNSPWDMSYLHDKDRVEADILDIYMRNNVKREAENAPHFDRGAV